MDIPMQIATQRCRERRLTTRRIDASAAGNIARWLRGGDARQTMCASRLFERLPGGAIQDNWTLDVEIDGGPWQGTHGFVLRTDARFRCCREPYARRRSSRCCASRTPRA